MSLSPPCCIGGLERGHLPSFPLPPFAFVGAVNGMRTGRSAAFALEEATIPAFASGSRNWALA